MDIDTLKRKIEREKAARLAAEEMLEQKSRLLYQSNKQLEEMNDKLAEQVDQKTQELQKTIAELEYINDELRDFAYIVSHDLKAPLRAIGSLAEWLCEDYQDQLDDDGKNQLQLLKSRADRMTQLIQGILEYSRAGKMTDEHEEVNLREEIQHIADSIEEPGKAKIIVSDQIPIVQCDRVKMLQVFQNLISNAIKYSDKDIPEVKVDGFIKDGFLHMMVSDNGPGIDPKYHDKIFKIFQTLHSRDDIESSGVGLAIVKKIINKCEGEISVSSEMGKGTTFTIKIPKP